MPNITIKFLDKLHSRLTRITNYNDILTTSHSQGACLFVQWVELEVHRAGEGERNSDAVQHVSIGEDPNVDVRHDDVVEVAFLFIGKEQIWHPYSVRFSQGQVFETT